MSNPQYDRSLTDFHLLLLSFFFFMIRRPPRSTLFPYTSSSDLLDGRGHQGSVGREGVVAQPAIGLGRQAFGRLDVSQNDLDRKSTRLNSSHVSISYAVFCLKKKKNSSSISSLPTIPRPTLSTHR